jgi:hypothetical protein
MNVKCKSQPKLKVLRPKGNFKNLESRNEEQLANDSPWKSTYDSHYSPEIRLRANSKPGIVAVTHRNDVLSSVYKNKPQNEDKMNKNRKSLPIISKKDDSGVFEDPDLNRLPKLNSKYSNEFQNVQHKNVRVSQQLEQIYDLNKDYFAHKSGNCLCVSCTCGNCKCGHSRQLYIPNASQRNSSLYQDDYTCKKALEAHQIYKAPVDICARVEQEKSPSINQSEFKPVSQSHRLLNNDFQMSPRKGDSRDGIKHIKAPFPKYSVYKENYPDWKSVEKPLIVACPVIFTTDKRFPSFSKKGTQNYGSFNRCDIQSSYDSKKFGLQQFKNPIGTDLELKNVTTSADAFQPRKQSLPGTISVRRFSMVRPYLGKIDQNYQNQYKTSYQNHVQEPVEICASRKTIINQRKSHFLTAVENKRTNAI